MRSREGSPPSASGRRSVRLSGMDLGPKMPAYLRTKKRVPWDPVEHKVVKDVLKHDQMLVALRNSFTWQPSASMTSQDWKQEPNGTARVLEQLGETRRQALAQRDAEAFEEGVKKLRAMMHKDSRYRHPARWDKSHHVSHFLNETLWRHPDGEPNKPPDLNFRPRSLGAIYLSLARARARTHTHTHTCFLQQLCSGGRAFACFGAQVIALTTSP